MQNWPNFWKFSFLRWKYIKTVIWLTIYNVHINKDFGIVTSWFVVYLQGERCSFPIQMWNYHMRGLCHDLWTICSPRLSQDIYSQILHNSLQIFSQRYSHSKPSYRRTSQYRLVIHVYEKLMLPVFRNILDIHVTIIHDEWQNTLKEEAFSAKKKYIECSPFTYEFFFLNSIDQKLVIDLSIWIYLLYGLLQVWHHLYLAVCQWIALSSMQFCFHVPWPRVISAASLQHTQLLLSSPGRHGYSCLSTGNALQVLTPFAIK